MSPRSRRPLSANCDVPLVLHSACTTVCTTAQVLALPLFMRVLRACGTTAAKRAATFDTGTKFFAVITVFLYPPLNGFLLC